MERYRIVQGDGPTSLADRVTAAMADGWVPVGGVAHLSYTYERGGLDLREHEWAQAMVYDLKAAS